jgi:hypothetical protein
VFHFQSDTARYVLLDSGDVIFLNKLGMGKLLLVSVALIAILELSHVRFEPCPLRLQSHALTTELTPLGRTVEIY